MKQELLSRIQRTPDLKFCNKTPICTTQNSVTRNYAKKNRNTATQLGKSTNIIYKSADSKLSNNSDEGDLQRKSTKRGRKEIKEFDGEKKEEAGEGFRRAYGTKERKKMEDGERGCL